MLERTSIVILKMEAVDLASLGDRWRKSSQETHQQSSTTTNIALIELLFPTPTTLLTLGFILTFTQLLRNPSPEVGVYRC